MDNHIYSLQAQQNGGLVFGEAAAFYKDIDTGKLYVVYRPVENLHAVLGRWQGTWSGSTLQVLPIAALRGIVGIWVYEPTGTVHVLRKHPALSLLNEEERDAEG